MKVANTGVRNGGTLAGNLMLKHAHNDFPSDLFILFESVATKLVIRLEDLK
jgi:xanthine dehydrogenase/oxidase